MARSHVSGRERKAGGNAVYVTFEVLKDKFRTPGVAETYKNNCIKKGGDWLSWSEMGEVQLYKFVQKTQSDQRTSVDGYGWEQDCT